MTNNPKDIKVNFAPGFFDNFEGTQEELDNFIKEIQESVASGEYETHILTQDEVDALPDHIRNELNLVMDAITEEGIDLDQLEADYKKRLN
jgi:Cdc6-like AAA superfamily ATPase